jgi:hypothetical protein
MVSLGFCAVHFWQPQQQENSFLAGDKTLLLSQTNMF